MAERPYITGATGAIAIGLVAAALHGISAPSPVAPKSSVSTLTGAHDKGVHASKVKPLLDQIAWDAEMKSHPEKLGRDTAESELRETLAEFSLSSAAQTKGNAKAEGKDKTPPALQQDQLQVMIAIEPDPIHTHLALLFDRDIDALEDALQDSGWQYQANWLPWSSTTESTAADHFADQQTQRLFLRGREQYPGLLLFRPADRSQSPCPPPCPDKPLQPSSAPSPCTDKTAPTAGSPPPCSDKVSQPPLAIFVVGNSPTGGIDRTQFEMAVSMIGNYVSNPKNLPILGPTFTGSGPSLRSLLLSEAIKNLNPQKITIVSGTLSDPNCDDLLPKGKLEKGHCVSDEIRNTTFVSFGIDTDWRSKEIDRFLENGAFRKDQIAELSEDESGYGYLHLIPSGQPLESHLRLYFPRNISHLRSAYEKSNIFGFGATTQGSGNLSLNLNFDEASGDDDAIPSFSAQQMPVSQEGVMHQITDVIEQRHIKVVILSATDVLDEVFVAEILARQAPNTLVIVNQTDNLFLNSKSGNVFDNMYFVSPWPLITDSQFWSNLNGSVRLRTFPSDLSEGVYVAVRYLFQSEGDLSFPDYSSPLTRTDRPPLWLSAIGHGDYWPVAQFEDSSSTKSRSPFHLPEIVQHDQPEGIFAVEHSPLSQHLLLLLIGLFAVYHTAKCLGVPALRSLSFRYSINDRDARVPKLCLQLGLTILLLLALEVSLSPSNRSLPVHSAFYLSSFALSIAAAYLICLILFPLEMPFPFPFTIGSLITNLETIGIVLIFVAPIYFSVLVSWRGLWHWLSQSSGFPDFFNYRASYPLRGISPVFPLFIVVAAFFVLLYNHMDRITFTRNMRPRLPTPVENLPNCPSELNRGSVLSLLRWPPAPATVANKLGTLIVIGGIAGICLKTLQLEPRMFDGAAVQGCVGVGMFLVALAIFWELLMAATIWESLKTWCLERLEASSLRRGFSSISGLTWSSLWILRGSLSSRYRAIYRLLEQSSRDIFKKETDLTESVEKLWNTIRNDSNHRNDSSPEDLVKVFGRVQRQIACVSTRLLKQLRVAWVKERHRITAVDALGAEETTSSSNAADDGKSINPLQQLREEWVALVYIHYARMVLLQIRSRLMTAATLYLFLVWAGTSYPYLNRHVLLIALSVLLGILSCVVIGIYASINRNAILSRATNHMPGHLDLDFYLKTASLVGIPLIGFVASQFPEVSGFLFSWIEPGMSTSH